MTLKKNQKTKHPVYYIVTLCDSYMLNGVKKKKKDKTKKKNCGPSTAKVCVDVHRSCYNQRLS